MPAPPLSVTIATLRGWPVIRPCLEALVAQAGRVGVEVVVADGSDQPMPSLPGHTVIWRRCGGADVLQLRLAAVRAARAPLVAVTEDHCLAAPSFCDAVLAAAARHPSAIVFKGRVENGSRERLVDWASFFMNQLPHLPPFIVVFRPVAGVSASVYRREALDALWSAAGDISPDVARDAPWHGDGRVVCDPDIAVTHVQSEGWIGTAALQYHNARIVSARVSRRSGRDWLRFLGAPALVWARTARTTWHCLKTSAPQRLVLGSVPAFVFLLHAKALGEVAGYVLGPGQSGFKLQ